MTNQQEELDDIIKYKKYRSDELNMRDILQIVDSILNQESSIEHYSDKQRNCRYVELKNMKKDDLFSLLINYELSKLSYESIKNLILSYEQKIQLQYKITDNSKVNVVEYMFDGDELKFWDVNDPDNHDEIDLNELIDWDEVYEKAVIEMKEYFKEGTKFIDVDNK